MTCNLLACPAPPHPPSSLCKINAQRTHIVLPLPMSRLVSNQIILYIFAITLHKHARTHTSFQVIHCHATFMSRALDGLMLCRLPLLRPLLALQQGALDFADRVNIAWDALEARQVRGQS